MSESQDLGVCAVTGSSGWFASYLVALLTQKGYKVHCLDIQARDPINKDINPYCNINDKLTTFYKCDITKYENVIKALKGVDTVFHVCAITDIRQCPSDLMYNVNVNGTSILLKACKECNIKQLIYTSSIEVVNDGSIHNNSTEDLKYVQGYNKYGTTKTLAEKLVINASKENDNLAVSMLRLAHLYGPGDPIIYALTKFPVNIGNGKCQHSFMYIENCAQAHIETAKALTSKSKRELCDGQAFNIKDHDYNFTAWYRDILCEKKEQTCIYIPYIVALIFAYIYDYIVLILFKLFNIRIGDPIETFGVLAVEAAAQQHTYSTEKFNKLIGYKPSIDVNESIKRTRDWRKRKYPLNKP